MTDTGKEEIPTIPSNGDAGLQNASPPEVQKEPDPTDVLFSRRQKMWWLSLLYTFVVHLIWIELFKQLSSGFFAIIYIIVMFFPALIILFSWPMPAGASDEDRFRSGLEKAAYFVFWAFLMMIMSVHGHGA